MSKKTPRQHFENTPEKLDEVFCGSFANVTNHDVSRSPRVYSAAYASESLGLGFLAEGRTRTDWDYLEPAIHLVQHGAHEYDKAFPDINFYGLIVVKRITKTLRDLAVEHHFNLMDTSGNFYIREGLGGNKGKNRQLLIDIRGMKQPGTSNPGPVRSIEEGSSRLILESLLNAKSMGQKDLAVANKLFQSQVNVEVNLLIVEGLVEQAGETRRSGFKIVEAERDNLRKRLKRTDSSRKLKGRKS